MSCRQDYIELRNTINDYHSGTFAYGKEEYVCLLVGESKNTPWECSAFSRLNLKGIFANVPNIQIGTQGLFGDRWSHKIAILAHEFGHYLSWKNRENPADGLHKKLYASKRITKREAKLIVEEERRAWKYGFKFLDDNGIEIEPEMRKFRNRCVARYGRRTKTLSR
jgi:hypothetical protein